MKRMTVLWTVGALGTISLLCLHGVTPLPFQPIIKILLFLPVGFLLGLSIASSYNWIRDRTIAKRVLRTLNIPDPIYLGGIRTFRVK